MRPLSRWLRVFFAVFARIASAALLNVTVDDVVSTGAVVPQYLPSPANWNAQVNGNCTLCTVKPDPTQAYNGTWHDATYRPSNGFTQVIEFTFTGSAVYIFFIIANHVGNSSTLTDVQFVLDQTVTAGRYTHPPTLSTDFQYNVAVYSNDSLAPGSHSMMVQPVNTGNNVLMLFDYLIYTIDTSSSISPSATVTATTLLSTLSGTGTSSTTATLPSSPTSSGTGGSSAKNTGAIVGASVGAVALVAAGLLCCRRYKKRREEPRPEEGAMMDPFILSPEAVTTPTIGTPQMRSSVTEPASKHRAGASSMVALPSNPPAPIDPPSSGATSSSDDPLREQVEVLRDEVARLRQLQEHSPDIISEFLREPPPMYSEPRLGTY